MKDYEERKSAETQMGAIIGKLQQRFTAEIPEAFFGVFPPPPVSGIGNAGSYKMWIQDRGDAGLDELQTQAFGMMMKANQTPGLAGNLSTFRANVPQMWLDVDRVKAKTMDVPLSNIFGTLQTDLGSAYVNDFNLYGRTYRVTAQADAQSASSPRTSASSRRATPPAAWSRSARSPPCARPAARTKSCATTCFPPPI